MKKTLIRGLITSVFALNIIGVANADFATPFVDTAEVGEISTERCWLISTYQNEYLVVVPSDTLEYIVLFAIADKGVADESLLGKPVILKAKVLEKHFRTDGNIYMRLEMLSVKPDVAEQPNVKKNDKKIDEERRK